MQTSSPDLRARPIGLRAETPRTPPRRLQVIRAEQISRHLRRITLGGPDLNGFPLQSDGSHIKLFFRRDGQRELTLPKLGPSGPVWPPAELKPLARTYTVSMYDAARDELGVAGPGGPNPLLRPADFYVLAGDLTAIPAISALLRMMPRDTRGQVLLEVPSPEDMLPLDAPEGVLVQWLFRRADEPSPLAAQVRKLELPASTFAFLAGEGGAVVTMRDYFLNERGFSKRQLYATPYWRAAQTEEQYHEERHRVMDELADEAADG